MTDRILCLISKREVAELLGIHPESLMRLVRAGRFPAPIKLQEAKNSRVRWSLTEITAWLEERIAQK